jgi:hypothetical protein
MRYRGTKTREFIEGTSSAWMTTEEMGVLLRISPNAVIMRLRRGAIPPHVVARPSGAKAGRRARLLFSRVAVERWLTAQLGGQS